jgi:hypothetical protein
MPTYRSVAGRGFMLVGIVVAAWLALSMLIGGWWQVRAALARPDIAEDIAAIQSNIIRAARQAGQPAAPTVADFAGDWNHHGFVLSVQPDGSAEAIWRTYQDPAEAPAGHALLTFDRVDGRTAYGRVLWTTGPVWPLGPVELTEYDFGVGELRASTGAPPAAAPGGPGDGLTVCGPRLDWERARIAYPPYPCGA